MIVGSKVIGYVAEARDSERHGGCLYGTSTSLAFLEL